MSGREEISAADFGISTTVKKTQQGQLLQFGTLDNIEKHSILEAMETYNGNLTKVAHGLGLSRGALYRRLDKYGIEYER